MDKSDSLIDSETSFFHSADLKNLCGISVLLLVLIMALIHAEPCMAQEMAGQLVFAKGVVLFSEDMGKSWKPVTPGMEFPEGTYIKTESGGEAALMLNDRSQIRISSGAVLYLKKNGSSPEEKVSRPGLLELFSGKLWFRNKRTGSKPVFATPLVSASIRGTEMAIEVEKNGQSTITVLEGQVLCRSSRDKAESAVIARGEALSAGLDSGFVITRLVRPENRVQWLLLTPDIIGPSEAGISQNSRAFSGLEKGRNALELLAAGEKGALELAESAVEISPETASPHVALATVLQSEGKFDLARREAEIALSIDPDSVPALIRTVELHLGLGEVKLAEKTINNFRKHEQKTAGNISPGGTDARVLMLEGYIALIKFDSEKAEILFREAVETRGDLAPAYLGLGLALYHRNRSAEALASMENASLIDPLSAYPHIYLAKAQYMLGERHEAEIELARASQLDPNDPTPYMYLATIMADTYRPAEGIAALQKSIALNDNRLMTRSRYLLDQDRASRNISLAWSLAAMGLYEWADAKGDQAVWEDETNSSAYLFRASKASVLGQLDSDTLGDMKRAELLKPVNSNTYASYNDYQSLIERPEAGGSITLRGGSDRTWRDLLNISGGGRNTAFNFTGGYSGTDGDLENTGNSYNESNLSFKQVIVPDHELVAGFRVIDNGDAESAFTGSFDRIGELEDTGMEYSSGYKSVGYHAHQGAEKDLILLVQSEKYSTDSSSLFEKYVLDSNQYTRKTLADERKSSLAELVQFYKLRTENFGVHGISAGISNSEISYSYSRKTSVYYDPPFPDASNDSYDTGSNPDKRVNTIFLKDILSLSDSLKLDLGMAWTDLDNIVVDRESALAVTEGLTNNSLPYNEKRGWLPHAGIMWQATPSDTLRAAYFRTSEPQQLQGSLQPSEVAGFSKISGANLGTWSEFYGAGWDRQWSAAMFTRAEINHEKRAFPTFFTSHLEDLFSAFDSNLTWNRESRDTGKISFEYLVTERLAAAVTYQIREHKAESGVERKRLDNDLGATFTWVHSSGIKIQNSWWYMNQDEGDGYEDPLKEEFVIASLSAEKALFDKKLLIFAKWDNIFNKKYSYLRSDETEVNQLPWRGSFAAVGFKWSF